MKTIVGDSFNVPTCVYTNHFTLKILTPDFAVLDYQAVCESKSRLTHIFSQPWAEEIDSFEKNLQFLNEDYADTLNRVGFTYILLNKAEDKCLGSVYIFPSVFEGYDVAIYYWVHIQWMDTSFEAEVGKFIRHWIKTEWPFKKVAYPGRDISWKQWLKGKRKKIL